MHVDIHFTDVWTTDGSKMTVHTPRGEEVRVACGAYAGIQPRRRHELVDPFYKDLPPDKLDRIGESEEDWHRRRISGGMKGMRLPAHYEVVDAELAAILMVLKEAAEGEGARRKRCLVMSDCASALRMMEAAWRAKGRRAYAMDDRGGMLEAICTYRERLELVITMYVPAHRGFAANSYADAAAKAACSLEHVSDISGVIKEAIKWKRYVSEVWVQGGKDEGRWEVWDVAPYEAMKEALGWWIVRKEYREQKGASSMVDETRIGPRWETYRMRRDEAIWTGTGGKGTGKARSEGEEKEEGSEEEQTRSEQGTTEVQRIGVAMAARGGNAWQATHGREAHARLRAEQNRGEEGAATRSFRMGCPACCGRSRGWGWSQENGKACWIGPAGEKAAEHATTMHVLGGQCIAIEHGSALKETMYKATQELAKATAKHARRDETEQQQRGTPRNGDRERGKTKWRVVATEASSIAHAAKGAVKKGKAATQHELDCLRAVLAGDIPRGGEGERSKKEETKRKAAARRAVRAIKDAQGAAAKMQEAWYKEAREEIAQRNAEEGMRRWIGPVAGAWERAQQTWRLNAAGRRVWIEEEDERGEDENGDTEGHEAQEATETPPHRKGAQAGAGLRYEAKKKKRRGRGQEREEPKGWSMARAMAEYKRWEWKGKGYSDKNEERWRQMEKERWEKEAGKERSKEADDVDDTAQDEGTGETEEHAQERAEKSVVQEQRKRAAETQHGDVSEEDHGKRQRGAEERDAQGRPGVEPGRGRQKNTRQREWPEEPRSVEQRGHEQERAEPTRAEGEDTQGTQQRDEPERDSSSDGRKRKGKERMSTHQLEQVVEQPTPVDEMDSSDEDELAVERRRRRQRGSGGSHDQPLESHKTSQTTQDGTTSMDAASIESTHEQKKVALIQDGGVTVNASVFVRRNPSRKARPQERKEATKPGRARVTKGPIFKGTYMPKAGARGGGLKYMIRLGKRVIERMENTYEAARPPRKGNER